MIACYIFTGLGASAMTGTDMTELEAAIYAAFVEAIEFVGLQGFKSTSLFGSNDSAIVLIAA